MRKWFYSKLAIGNIIKNRRTEIPYLLTCIVTVAMFYMVTSLTFDPGLDALPAGGDMLRTILSMGIVIIALFAVIFLFYTHSFLIKRRQKEFGLYNVLGMEKKHIGKMMLLETLYEALCAIVIGLALGMLFSQLMMLLLFKVLGSTASFMMKPQLIPILLTATLFLVIFTLILLHSLLRVHLSNPVTLLKGGNVGEREPKNKIIITLLGLVCLGLGYYLAITITNPIMALTIFFIAVILVIVGTYLLFTSGSITLLKTLRKNKRYYYKTNHFISVSGMLYRMKQNAVGLANICVLSTMVVVMLSTTTSLIVGMEDALLDRYKHEFVIDLYETGDEINTKANAIIDETLKREGLELLYRDRVRSLRVHATYQNGKYLTGKESLNAADTINVIKVLPLEDFKALTGVEATLAQSEIMLFANNTADYFYLDDQVYPVAASGSPTLLNNIFQNYIQLYDSVYVITADANGLQVIFDHCSENANEISPITNTVNFDTGATRAKQQAFHITIREALREGGITDFHISSRANDAPELYGLYTGFFFLGLFLGFLFLMATVLILYYKQISEGYDDQARFRIMQNVGLSKSEVKKAIHSQTLTLFFLPLIMTFIHLVFAFPMIKRIMYLMNMPQSAPFALYTVLACALFSTFYIAVYLVTARTYGKIVGENA